MASTRIEIKENATRGTYTVTEAGRAIVRDASELTAYSVAFTLIHHNHEDGERVRLTHPGGDRFNRLDTVIETLQ
jgi:hypothetical protein